MHLFDTHAHLYDPAFNTDRDELLPLLFKKMDGILCPSENIETSEKSVELARKYSSLYAGVGIHPSFASEGNEKNIQRLKDLAAQEEKVKAIGEAGLDYCIAVDKNAQKEAFVKQILLAEKLDLPLIVHDRKAHGDVLALLKKYKSNRLRGILHSYSGSAETARECIKLGFYISFSGSVSFEGSRRVRKTAAAIPLDRLLAETDSPFQSPPPYQHQRNTPLNLFYIVKSLAEIKGISVDEMAKITEDNARKIYSI